MSCYACIPKNNWYYTECCKRGILSRTHLTVTQEIILNNFYSTSFGNLRKKLFTFMWLFTMVNQYHFSRSKCIKHFPPPIIEMISSVFRSKKEAWALRPRRPIPWTNYNFRIPIDLCAHLHKALLHLVLRYRKKWRESTLGSILLHYCDDRLLLFVWLVVIS